MDAGDHFDSLTAEWLLSEPHKGSGTLMEHVECDEFRVKYVL